MSEVGQKNNEKAAKIWRVGTLPILLEKMQTRYYPQPDGTTLVESTKIYWVFWGGLGRGA